MARLGAPSGTRSEARSAHYEARVDGALPSGHLERARRPRSAHHEARAVGPCPPRVDAWEARSAHHARGARRCGPRPACLDAPHETPRSPRGPRRRVHVHLAWTLTRAQHHEAAALTASPASDVSSLDRHHKAHPTCPAWTGTTGPNAHREARVDVPAWTLATRPQRSPQAARRRGPRAARNSWCAARPPRIGCLSRPFAQRRP